jgi:carboxymethylenebutenolidase
MCYETTARPPLPPIAGGAGIAASGDLVLRAADGNRFLAFTATSSEPGAPGVVILPDVRGLHAFYTDLAERFASAGVHATAFDYFGRTAGTGARAGDFPFMEHVQRTTPDGVASDVAAAVAHVRSAAGGAATAVSTVGFCFGGRASFNQAARGHGLDGVIGFYGPPQQRGDDDPNAPTALAPGYACKVLGLFGGEDSAIPAEAVAAFDAALSAAGVAHELVTYPGAPHSFFDRKFGDFRDDCDDAWRRVLAFVGRGA